MKGAPVALEQWRQSFRAGLNHPGFRTALATRPEATLAALLELKRRSGLNVVDFNQEIVEGWSSSSNEPIPTLSEDQTQIQFIPYAFIGMAKLPYDVFVQFVLNSQITGKDLFALCNAHPAINEKCNARDQNLFRILLQRDLKVDESNEPRTAYFNILKSKVWVFGSNTQGQLGLPASTRYITTPTVNPRLKGIVAAACGNMCTLYLDYNGDVWVSGYNYGSLMLGQASVIDLPIKHTGLANIVMVAATGRSFYSLDNTGQLWVFGDNSYGQLGLGDNMPSVTIPMVNPNLPKIVYVAADYDRCICIDEKGQAWMFGRWAGLFSYNNRPMYYGAENDPPVDNIRAPVKIKAIQNVVMVSFTSEYGVFLTGQGQVYIWNGVQSKNIEPDISGFSYIEPDFSIPIPQSEYATPILIKELNGIVAVASGNRHSLFLDQHGLVWVMGEGTNGQLGMKLPKNTYRTKVPFRNPHLRNIRKIAASVDRSMCIDKDGRVWAFGLDNLWETGRREQTIDLNLSTLMYDTPGIVQGLSNITSLSLGSSFTIAISL